MNTKISAFFHVNFIPMNDEHVLNDQTVIVKDGHIAEIGTTPSVKVPVEAVQIETANQYLIPALAITHQHTCCDP